MPVASLNEAIVRTLRESVRPLRAREVARVLSRAGHAVVRRDVNRALYSDLATFARNDNWEWTLAGGDGVKASSVWRELAGELPTPHAAMAQWPQDPRLYDWQHAALSAWLSAGRRGIVAAVTGAGKTRAGLAAVENHLLTDRRSRAVVLVPTIELMHQWRRELAGWFGVAESAILACGGGELDSVADGRVIVYVAASASKWLPEEVNEASTEGSVLLVADECHRYGADAYGRALDGIYGATLGLSATPERDYDSGMEDRVIPAIGEVVFDYGYEQGLDEGVITDFSIAFVALDFDPSERVDYDTYSDRIAELRRSLDSRYPYLRSGRDFFAQLNLIASREHDPLALAYLGAVGGRRAVLMDAEAREEFVAWMVDALPAKRKAILFHERIEGAEWLAAVLAQGGIAAAAHHSGLSRQERAEALARFRDGRVRVLVAPRTLDEGIDVPDADLAVIVAGSTVKRQRIQRIGRVLRRASGKEGAQVVVLYVRGTREDPAERPEGDRFFEVMEGLDRASHFHWPHEGDELAYWLQATPSPSRPKPLDSAAALFVCQDQAINDQLARQLAEHGVRLRVVESGDAAEAACANDAPRLLIVYRWFDSSEAYRPNERGSDTFKLVRAIRSAPGSRIGQIVMVDKSGGAPPTAIEVDHVLKLPYVGDVPDEEIVKICRRAGIGSLD